MAHKGWYYESLNSDSEDGMGAREDKVGKWIRCSNESFLGKEENRSSGLAVLARSPNNQNKIMQCRSNIFF